MLHKTYFYVLLVCLILTVVSMVYLGSERIYHMMNRDLRKSSIIYTEHEQRSKFKPVLLKSEYMDNMVDREFSSSHNNNTALKPNSKFKVGVLIPSTTRGIKIKDIKAFSLVDISIRSINETMESRYEYTIYAGVDLNDSLLSYQDYIEGLPVSLNVVMVRVSGGTFTKVVNVIAETAVKDGMDYLVRINDDIKFVTYYWTSLSIISLQNNDPPNVGVVGPTCRQGNTAIMTTDFVHVTHYNIFGFYYPPPLDNWWADDWITRVYEPLRSTRLSTWEVIHEMRYGQRYRVDMKQENKLRKLIELGKQSITSYINNTLRHV